MQKSHNEDSEMLKNDSKDNYILGIFCYFRDSSACLLHNGKIIAMVEEERFTREKHCSDFPENSIRFCLNKAGISMSDISYVAYGFKPWLFLLHQTSLFIKNFPKSLNLFHSGVSHMPLGKKLISLASIPQRLCKTFDAKSVKLIYVDHHLAHAYSSYYVSPFDKAAILITDNFGEINSTSFYFGRNDDMQLLSSIPYPNSLGMYYGGLTEYLGFRPENDEYKVMGMCAYGNDRYLKVFEKILKVNGKFSYKLDTTYFDLFTHGVRKWMSSKIENELEKKRGYEDPYREIHFDIARSAQSQLENIARHIGKSLQSKTNCRNLCVGGGVAQNILMNRVLLDDCGYEEIFVPPVAYDGGISLGAALAVYHQLFNDKRQFVLNSSSWGPNFSNDECINAIRKSGLSFESSNDFTNRIVDLLTEGKIIGYFDGQMEIGPRALGNRSIFADPRRKYIKDILNSRIKKREFFRPFAAMVTLEDAQTFFDLPVESPFMTLCGRVKAPDVLQGITHNDGTSRIQTVRQELFPEIHALIKRFQERTNIPVLLNTSFNENEPIVCTPQEAIDCFLRTHMDALVFNHQLLVLR